MTKDECLDKAKELVNGDRALDYGDAHFLHSRVARMLNVYLQAPDGARRVITAQDVAVMMILLKIARVAHRATDDSFVDICGYAALATEMYDA